MNSFEEIIKKEKEFTYAQRNKELFSFYTLTLIAQEQATKKIKRKLWAFLLLLTACSSLLLSPTIQMMGYLADYLSSIDIFGIFNLAVITYGVIGLCIVLFKREITLFR
jgi:uncharacterized membrane protein